MNSRSGAGRIAGSYGNSADIIRHGATTRGPTAEEAAGDG